MNAKEAYDMALRNTMDMARHAISVAATQGSTRTGCNIREVHLRERIVRELTTDGYRVTPGDHDGDISIDWGTP